MNLTAQLSFFYVNNPDFCFSIPLPTVKLFVFVEFEMLSSRNRATDRQIQNLIDLVGMAVEQLSNHSCPWIYMIMIELVA